MEGIDRKIICMGCFDYIEDLYLVFDVFVFFLVWGEGWFNVVGEVMVCGVVVVGIDVGEMCNVIGDIGLVVVLFNLSELVNVCIMILEMFVEVCNELGWKV